MVLRLGAKRAQLLEPFGDQVVVVGGELEPPAVEAEVQKHRLVVEYHRDGAKIPRPGVIGGHLADNDPFQVDAGRSQVVDGRGGIGRRQHHPLKTDDLADNLHKDRTDIVQHIGPIGTLVGPGQHIEPVSAMSKSKPPIRSWRGPMH